MADYIPDVKAAILNGTIPGKFLDAGIPGSATLSPGIFQFPEITHNAQNGTTLVWTVAVWVIDASKNMVCFNPEWTANGAVLPAGTIGVWKSTSFIRGGTTADSGKERDGGLPVLVLAGKRLKTKNATNAVSQAILDANSAYKKRLRTTGIAAATSNDRLVKLMLVDRMAPPTPEMTSHWAEYSRASGGTADCSLKPADIVPGLIVQRKYDGVSRIATMDNGEPILYSRNMMVFRNQYQAIDAALVQFFANAALTPYGEGLYLVGELYRHGLARQEINSLGSGGDPSGRLQYIVYDCFWWGRRPNNPVPGDTGVVPARLKRNTQPKCTVPSWLRQEILTQLMNNCNGALIRAENFAPQRLAPDQYLTVMQWIYSAAEFFINEGYEGAIVRRSDGVYVPGARTRELLKVKKILDSEYEVINFTGEGKGKNAGAVRWVLQTPAGARFDAEPKNLTYNQRYALFQALSSTAGLFESKFKGRMMTIEYDSISNEGIPLQVKAVGFRTDETTGEPDPLEALMAQLNVKG